MTCDSGWLPSMDFLFHYDKVRPTSNFDPRIGLRDQFLIHCGKILGSNFVKITNQGVRDEERFFMSKWPDLKIDRFKKGGDDTATPQERPWSSSPSEASNLLQADQFNPSLLSLIQLEFKLIELDLAQL
ncbi:hypothetical protein PVK06_047664 [Gossypium arboreum]|uniref:Uncharacterized protein n=1 Tax=Gossypium arboreum TaxID=29729 RepID=A0ABR0MDX7_GOSAR|nr:hypothetical protein PVK06_047664 [Gossypium arboreum]